jgi:hypothetical protein
MMEAMNIWAVLVAAIGAFALGGMYLFERKSLKLFAINGGYHTLQFALYGLVLGLIH